MREIPPDADEPHDPRVPVTDRSLLAGAVLAAAVPLAVLALSAPAVAAVYTGFGAAAAVLARRVAPRLRRWLGDRTASLRVPGVDLRIEVALVRANGEP